MVRYASMNSSSRSSGSSWTSAVSSVRRSSSASLASISSAASRIVAHQPRNGVQGVEQEMRVQLHLEGLDLGTSELHFELRRAQLPRARHTVVPCDVDRGDDPPVGQQREVDLQKREWARPAVSDDQRMSASPRGTASLRRARSRPASGSREARPNVRVRTGTVWRAMRPMAWPSSTVPSRRARPEMRDATRAAAPHRHSRSRPGS